MTSAAKTKGHRMHLGICYLAPLPSIHCQAVVNDRRQHGTKDRRTEKGNGKLSAAATLAEAVARVRVRVCVCVHWNMSLAIASCHFCSNIFWQPSICTNSQLHMQHIPLPTSLSPRLLPPPLCQANQLKAARHKRIARMPRASFA